MALTNRIFNRQQMKRGIRAAAIADQRNPESRPDQICDSGGFVDPAHEIRRDPSLAEERIVHFLKRKPLFVADKRVIRDLV